ncbi:MAG: VanZ family protein [Flavobacteriales bacterium]|nr:VanZ family protein [Flavobacteriales bacterium]
MFFRHNFITILWLLIIAAVCLIPGRNVPQSPYISFDKLFHTAIFGCLTFQMMIGLKKQYTFKRLRYQAVPCSIIFSIFYGLLMELLQGLLLPDRSFDALDALANTLGVMVGWLLFELIFYKMDKTTVRL